MKVKNYLVILAGSAIVLASSGRSSAQTQLSWDGYAVTPKLRQTMENGGTAGPAMGGGEVIAGESTSANIVIAARPGQQTVVFAPTYYESQNIGYRTTWDDGIAASPRLRQMMMENKYPMTAMGGSQFIAGESAGGNVIVGPQSQRVWVESHPGIVAPRTYSRPRGVGYEVTSDYGIAAPPRAWKMMCESPANKEMMALR